MALDDSTIWIADGIEANVRRFSLRGSHLQTFGRPGDGPGEFREPVSLSFVAPARFAVLDRQCMTVSIWVDAGHEVQSWRHRMLIANSLAVNGGRLLLFGVARRPDGERAVQEMDFQGTVLRSYGPTPRARHPREASLRLYVGDRVGPATVYTHSSTNTVWDVTGDSVIEGATAVDVYHEWTWEERPAGGGGLQQWLESQVWTTDLFGVDDSTYVVALGYPVRGERRYRYRYSLMRRGARQLAVSSATDVRLFGGRDGVLVGVVELPDGGAEIALYRLAADARP